MKESQRKAMFARLKRNQPYKDYDRDGVVNKFDCNPVNPNKQGWIHDLKKRHSIKVRKKEKELEKEQDKLLREIDDESTGLKRQLELQKRINENKRLKEEVKQIKKARFEMTPAGKAVAFVRSPKTQKTVKKGLKKLWKEIS